MEAWTNMYMVFYTGRVLKDEDVLSTYKIQTSVPVVEGLRMRVDLTD